MAGQGTRSDPCVHLGTKFGGEDVGAVCVNVDGVGGDDMLWTEARTYEVDTEELFSSVSVKGGL